MRQRLTNFNFEPVQALFIILVIAGALLSILPLYWTVTSSLLSNEAAMSLPPKLIPEKVSFNNYDHLVNKTSALRWLLNSTIVSSISALLVVYLATLAAYPLAKKQFPGVKVLFFIILGFMTIPREVILLPLFLMMKQLNFFDTYLGLLLPTIAWPFAVFLMKQFIGTIPSEVFDAAEVDGCSPMGMFHRILLPMIKPALGALSVFAFVHAWNDYIWQLIVVSSDKMKTLPLGVASLSDEFVYNYGLLMAGASMGGVPILIVFLMFQRFFTSGITLGAVKG
ncbi:MAG: binding-protein-dependent transport system inner rane component [Paenibacillus sp.]|jgi:multiple sugar transport system permease protein|nr:binding-protein-dependent transport system inner rane component [Paenibacillus sp.]